MRIDALDANLAAHPRVRLNFLFRRETGIAALAMFVAATATFAASTSEAPYIWAGIGVTTIFVCAASVSRRSWIRALWVNLAVITLTCLAGEVFSWTNEPLQSHMQYSEGFFVADDVLGYKPSSGQILSHRTSTQNELLYHVTYTLNQDGLRVSSPVDAVTESHTPCIMFFGDSFTFGEGMPDEQTMPYQVWKNLGGQYRTVNFGFLGYGPHQMLAAIQHGHLQSRGHCHPGHIIYQAIPTHVSRAAGLEVWDHHGPRYVLNAKGQAQPSGHFDDAPPASALERLRAVHRQFSPWLKTTLEGSALYRTLLRTHRPVDEQDAALLGAIIGESRQQIQRTYPEAQFHVILWDYDDDRQVVEQIQRALAQQDVQVAVVSTIMPDFPTGRARYEISRYDRHPNALAHELIAQFITRNLIRHDR